ncbi:MAG: preprotein translocase subunit SecG [Verrucomicrobiia bacterium AMD-G2]|nr:MAG: preprotein translocase subunit SecG [Verrucomicrobiae bacterium AMD-G2]
MSSLEKFLQKSFLGAFYELSRNFSKTSLYKLCVALHISALMTLLGINYLNVSITALLVIYVFVCLFMILLVLMQRPKQEGLGAAFGANTTDQLFGARTTNVLQKGTVYMAVLFFVLTLTLAILMQRKSKINSLAKTDEPAAEIEEVQTPVATSLSEELEATATTTTATTAPVSVPADAAAPEAVQPEAAQPEAAQPEAAQPEAAQPEAAHSQRSLQLLLLPQTNNRASAALTE